MRLKVENFQSLRDVNIELAPFTVISGASDQGKSSLVRAIEACLFNTEGKDFISWGQKRCAVSLDDDKDSIQYSKGTSTSYMVNEKGYSAIGRGPFKAVTELGYGEIDAEHMKVRPQLSKQYDAPFLIADEYSPTAVASILGTLSDSTIVTKAKKALEGDLRELVSKVNYVESEVESMGAEVVSQEQDILALSALREKISLQQAKNLSLHEQMNKLVLLEGMLNGLSAQVKNLLKTDLDSRNSLSTLSVVVLPTLEKKNSLAARIMSLHERRTELAAQISELEDISFNLSGIMDFDVSKLENTAKNYTIVENLAKIASNLAKIIKYLHDCIVLIAERLKAAPPFLERTGAAAGCLEAIHRAGHASKEIKSLEDERLALSATMADVEMEMKQFKSCPLCERHF